MFAPASSAVTVKIAVAVANKKDWLLWHLDTKRAFIQTHLDEAICMRLPAGCRDNSQRSLGGTTYGHPYEATRARGVPEAP